MTIHRRYVKKGETMKRLGMAMIELIFAIVIIAISVITIPTMMNIADQASETIIVDEDALKRMMGEIVKVSKARWDENYQDTLNSGEARFLVLQIDPGDCVQDTNGTWRRKNPYSNALCQDDTVSASAIPAPGDLNLSRGIEQLNGNSYDMALEGVTYTIPVDYTVSYVSSGMGLAGTTGSTTWTLGASGTPNPGAAAGATHLKRVVVQTQDPDRGVDMTLTFFKSNVGKF